MLATAATSMAQSFPGGSHSMSRIPRTMSGVMRYWILVSIALSVAVGGCGTKGTSTATPSRAAAMNFTLDVCGNRKIQSATASDIRREVNALDSKRDDAFLMLGASDMTYIQTTGDQRNGFIVEYQETDVRHHYRAKRKLTADEIVKALVSYSAGSDEWKRT